MLRPRDSAVTTVRTLELMPVLERGPGTLAVNRLEAVALSAARPRYRVFSILRCQAEPRINTIKGSLCHKLLKTR